MDSSVVRMDLEASSEELLQLYNQPHNGQMKLHVYINQGHVTVHVVQGRFFKQQAASSSFDTFVKLSLSPDASQKTFCETDVMYDTAYPLFDQKFTFPIGSDDFDKRVLLSTWQLDMATRRSHLLGCMSFGVRHLATLDKDVCGWYFLLTEEAGRLRHLQVPEALEENTTTSAGREVDAVMRLDRQRVVLKRGSEGYGFALQGSSPTFVSRVTPSAEAGGLQKDDFICRVNGEDVSGSSCDAVARVIKHSHTLIHLEVLRLSHLIRNTPESVDVMPEVATVADVPTEVTTVQVEVHREFNAATDSEEEMEHQPPIHRQTSPSQSAESFPDFFFHTDHTHPHTRRLSVCSETSSTSSSASSTCSITSSTCSASPAINRRAPLPKFIQKLQAEGSSLKKSARSLIAASLPSLRMKGLFEEYRSPDAFDCS